MSVAAYYNENDPFAAAWLRELIAWGLIAEGDVDERSIEDVCADDLRGYIQCHFFAGIGVWPYAMHQAGWPWERPGGSGSCPCGPFSEAGKGLGFDDPRHLWPAFFRLIVACRKQGQRWTDTIFGEQSANARFWVDLVRNDLEGIGAAFASVDIPAAGFEQGPHRRQRFYWVADLHNAERWADLAAGHFGDWPQTGRVEGYGQSRAGVPAGGMANGHGSNAGAERQQRSGEFGQQQEDRCALVGLGHHHQGPSVGSWHPDERGALRVEGPAAGASGTLLGCDWLLCSDARIRPVEAGTFPLDATAPGRLGLLRGYGNSLDFKTALNFVGAYMEAEMLS